MVSPVKNAVAYLEEILSDPALSNVYFDISWDEVAKYVVASDATTTVVADMINRYPDRFLFGTDVVAPKSAEQYFAVYEMYQPLWAKLTPDAQAKGVAGQLRAPLRCRPPPGSRVGKGEPSLERDGFS